METLPKQPITANLHEGWISMSPNKEINREVGWSIVLSVLMMPAGIVAIIVPAVSGIALAVLIGWLLVLRGATHMAYVWDTRRSGDVLLEILLQAIYVVAGGYLLLHPMTGLKALALVLAAYLLVQSVQELILSFWLSPLPASGWLLFDAMITLIFAVMIWRTWPASTERSISTLLGISLLISGVARLMICRTTRCVANVFQGELNEPARGR